MNKVFKCKTCERESVKGERTFAVVCPQCNELMELDRVEKVVRDNKGPNIIFKGSGWPSKDLKGECGCSSCSL